MGFPTAAAAVVLLATAAAWEIQTRPVPILITGNVETMCVNHTAYSFSKPWLVNFSVRLFSVTVRTT